MKTHMSLLLLYVIFASSCQSSKVSSSNAGADSLAAVGADKDKHGCLLSAGYTWSQLRGECIRPFEQGIALHTLNTSSAYQTSAYLLVDSSKNEAEVFIPEEQNSIMLNQRNTTTYTNGRFTLVKDSNCWTLSLNKTALYQEKK
ncbi:hypothetical protein [Sphingobacterium faecale]|uniref:Lipoprotein n=1 Tax=Sphingobacterium faecale TaxID=2803775 RepID=A0ABS1R5I8_9SPHI|nr:hypothetical protein [Sphingobacterium faecale]MBL1409963.1 hypothetical protein [Sphingobacterium faecale]